MSAPDIVKRGKGHLALSMVIVGLALVGGPYVLAFLSLMSGLRAYAWVVLVVAYIGILLKAAIGYLVTRDFRYDKTAYDLNVLVFGGTLTCTALQIVTPAVLFPGLQDISFLAFTTKLGLELRGQHLAMLFGLLLVSLLATVLSAMGVADTEGGKTSWLWTLFCSVFAYALLASYALTLIAKG